MTSLKNYSLNISEQAYHDYPAWSYSIIAKYAKDGFSALSTLHDKVTPTASMEFGSLFDSILTKGKATLDEYVVDTTGVSVPPAEKSVFDTLLSMGYGQYSYDNLCSMYSSSISDAMQACDSFCSKYKKPETRYAKLADNVAYWDLIRSGKKVVSMEDWEDAMEMYRIFRSDNYLKTLFGTNNTDKVEYIYQAQFLVQYQLDSGKDVDIKIMPDLLVVNHETRTIQPVDLKTSSSPAWNFKENFLKFRYDIQACLYSDVLELVKDKDLELRDYTILPYLFTCISRSDKVPVTYVYDQTSETQANGLTFTVNDKMYSYKSWQELLQEIISYEEMNAKVPSYIITDGPNNLLDILSK